MMNAIICLLVVFSILSLVLADRCGLNSECSSGITTNCNQYCCTGNKFPDLNEANNCASITCSCPTGKGYPAPSPTYAPVSSTTFNGYSNAWLSVYCWSSSDYDLNSMFVATADACQTKCYQYGGSNPCIAFVYRRSTSYCVLKSGLQSCSVANGADPYDTYVMLSRFSTTGWGYITNFDYGTNLKYLAKVPTGQTIEQCIAQCQQSQSCAGFSYCTNDNNCLSKWSCLTYTSAQLHSEPIYNDNLYFGNYGYIPGRTLYMPIPGFPTSSPSTLTPTYAPTYEMTTTLNPTKAPTQQLTGTLAPTPFLVSRLYILFIF